MGLSVLSPQVNTEDLFEWWQQNADLVGKEPKQGLNLLVFLGTWTNLEDEE